MRWLAAALAIGLGLLAPAAAAQEVSQPLQPALNLLTLDKERVYRQSLSGARIEAQFQAENEALAAENRKIEAELEAEERALTERRPSLGVPEFQALAEDFNARTVALREAQLSKARALEQRREAERQKFFQALVPVLGEIMQQLGAVVILDDKAVLLSFAGIDITDEAIRRLDALEQPAPEADPDPAATAAPAAPSP